MTTLKMNLSELSANSVARMLDKRFSEIERRSRELCRRLTDVGLPIASVLFSMAYYDGINDSNVSAEPTDTGWRIIASGQAVCFIEFGAGIYFNGEAYNGKYAGDRPPGIAGIGQYGSGHGADKTADGKPKGWHYRDGGEYKFTYGNPAVMPMYYASEEMRSQVISIAREVFAS